MKKIMYLFITALFVLMFGCNNEQIPNSSNANKENTTETKSVSKDQTKISIVPISNNSNYVVPIQKNTSKYKKTDISSIGGGKGLLSSVTIFDSSRIIGDNAYDNTSSDSVYNKDGTIFIDGNILNNEFSDKPNTLEISKAYGNYTIVKSTIAEKNDFDEYFTDNFNPEVRIFLYNTETREKAEIKNVEYARLQGKYIITDKEILDTDLNVVLPENKKE